jgi:hypothetical protein
VRNAESENKERHRVSPDRLGRDRRRDEKEEDERLLGRSGLLSGSSLLLNLDGLSLGGGGVRVEGEENGLKKKRREGKQRQLEFRNSL